MFYKVFAAFALLVMIGAGCLPSFENPAAEPDGDDNSVDENPICQDVCGNDTCEEIVCQGSDCPCAETSDSCPQDCAAPEDDVLGEKDDLIFVNYAGLTGAPGSISALVTGEARGNWYFEASFPVKVYNGANELIGSGIATAQGDWMTADYVPFTATISLDINKATGNGKVVLEKDNPSGLPENDNSLTVPIEL